MESLTKQQLILVALLISFVTSLMTGIVTVSLMDQAPPGVTRTITQVIRETVAGASGASSTATASSAVDPTAEATAAVLPSIVRLRDKKDGQVHGQGLIVSEKGVIMTDKTMIDGMVAPEMVFSDGTAVPVAVVRYQIEGDIAFLEPTIRLMVKTKPIAFTDRIRLGSTVWALSGTTTFALSQGIVSEANTASVSAFIHTTISPQKLMPGSPLFTATGAVAGIYTDSGPAETEAVFYSVNSVKGDVPI